MSSFIPPAVFDTYKTFNTCVLTGTVEKLVSPVFCTIVYETENERTSLNCLFLSQYHFSFISQTSETGFLPYVGHKYFYWHLYPFLNFSLTIFSLWKGFCVFCQYKVSKHISKPSLETLLIFCASCGLNLYPLKSTQSVWHDLLSIHVHITAHTFCFIGSTLWNCQYSNRLLKW